MTISNLANQIILSWGVKRYALAFVAGALAALSMPPFGLFPVLLISFPVLFWLIDGAASGRKGLMTAAFTGWWFGFGYHLMGLWWIGMAFLVEAERFAYAMPLAVVALPAALAFFTAFGTLVARLIWPAGPMRLVSLALGLSLGEAMRGTLFTGFPWNLYGYALTQMPWLAQSASVVGVYGLTFLVPLVFATPALAFDEGVSKRWRILPMVLALLTLGSMAAWGHQRLMANATGRVEGIRLRLVQPNIAQDQRFRASARDAVMERYKTLSDRPASADRSGIADVTHLIWPESAFPFFLVWDAKAMGEIRDLLSPGATLITGAARPDTVASGERLKHAYNSVYVIGKDGVISATYDKAHLVPFGEYVPDFVRKLGIDQIIDVPGGFTAASRRRLISVQGAPKAQPLVCYEIIFPGAVLSDDGRADWIINVTNDAWFGQTPGPYQHLHMTQVRAIEEGLPVVRAANSGISAIIDPLGRILRQLPLGEEGILDGELPKPLTRTLFSRFGHWPLAGAWLLLFVVATVVSRRLVRYAV